MLHVENMTSRNFSFAVRLTDTMNWNQTEEDFKFMLELEPQGCFVLFDDAKPVGIVTTVSFGKIGWLGNLIITEAYREKGAGTLLAQHAVEYLTSKNSSTIGLYAYVDKIPFYNRLGFKYDSEFIILNGRGFTSQLQRNLKEADRNDIQEIIRFDRICFGSSRRKLLEPILLNLNNPCYLCLEDKRMLGYAIAKKYSDMAEIGPLVCRRGRSDVAVDLLKTILNKLKGLHVSVCVPKKESQILNMLMTSGFREDFRVARMFFQPEAVKDCVYIAESLERG
jgi:predicted N-acetyltransferase YhbS